MVNPALVSRRLCSVDHCEPLLPWARTSVIQFATFGTRPSFYFVLGSSTRDSSKKRHLRSRHHSSSSSSSSRSSRRRRSRSKSSSRSYGSRGHRRSKHSGRRRSHSRSGSERSWDRTDRFGRRINPTNVTNSKDPKAVASRIFLGSLPADITREDVEARFSKHGKIQGKSFC